MLVSIDILILIRLGLKIGTMDEMDICQMKLPSVPSGQEYQKLAGKDKSSNTEELVGPTAEHETGKYGQFLYKVHS